MLRVDSRDVALTAPRLVGRDEACQALPEEVARPPKILRITEFLRMDHDVRDSAGPAELE